MHHISGVISIVWWQWHKGLDCRATLAMTIFVNELGNFYNNDD